MLLSLACSARVDSSVRVDPPTTEPPGTDPVPPPPALEIAWGSCTIPSGRDEYPAECATVDLPVSRKGGVRSATTVPVAVYRLKSKRQPAKATMWFLNGGPGGSGFSLAPFADIVAGSFSEGIDAYLIDHRGTGESKFLQCPRAMRTANTMDEFMQLCSREVATAVGEETLMGFSTTESAHDVRELIDATAKPEQKVFLYGGSYGSYWAHRLLQLPNVRLDAVVTDGNCFSSTCSFDTPQTFGVDEAMSFVFARCKQDATCSARLGADPQGFGKALAAKLATGHCSAATVTQGGIAGWLMATGVIWPAGLAPVLYRLDRCSSEDVRILNVFASKLDEVSGARRTTQRTANSPAAERAIRGLPNWGPVPEPDASHDMSTALQMHIIASEMMSSPPPSEASLRAKAASLTFKPDASSFDLSAYAKWKGYPRDEYVDGWVKRDIPWLALQGTFDFQTVPSLLTRATPQIQNPRFQPVQVDGEGHGVAFSSACAVTLVEQFLKDPNAKLDTSCFADLAARSLNIDARYTEYFFGTREAWD
jgi:pimeloyl-ACP methyl ester carboxylesterase